MKKCVVVVVVFFQAVSEHLHVRRAKFCNAYVLHTVYQVREELVCLFALASEQLWLCAMCYVIGIVTVFERISTSLVYYHLPSFFFFFALLCLGRAACCVLFVFYWNVLRVAC